MWLYLPQVLNASQLARFGVALKAMDAHWSDGRATAGHQGAAVKHNQQLDVSSAVARELGGEVLAALERNALFVSAALPNRLSAPLFNRYDEGMQFGTHVDGAIRMLDSAQKLRTDLSATLFLSSPHSYAGGELIVENDYGQQSIKLDAGDMIIYSAAARHRVMRVGSGERLACVLWIQSLVRGDAERLSLFELDRTIQRLTDLGTESDCLIRLTAHYHTLLRFWSET